MSKIENKKRKQRSQNRGSGNIPGFLQKTYKILENPEYQDIICWTDDGKAFKVKKPSEFSEKVLPKYFKHNNFASFVRQLNMYDFHKLRNDSEENEWRHKQFKRGSPQLLCEIKRKITENPNQELSLVSTNETDKMKDCQVIFKEMLGIKNKQEGLEKTCAILIAQNNQILAENKILWSELMKNKEKNNRKMEKLFSIFLSYIGPNFLQSKKSNDMILNDIMNQESNQEENKFISNNDELMMTQNNLQQLCNQYNNKDADKIFKKLFKNNSIKKIQGKEKKAITFDNFVEGYHKNNQDLLHNLNQYIQPEAQKKRKENSFDLMDDQSFSEALKKKVKPNYQQIEYQFPPDESSKMEDDLMTSTTTTAYYKPQQIMTPMLNYYSDSNNNNNNYSSCNNNNNNYALNVQINGSNGSSSLNNNNGNYLSLQNNHQLNQLAITNQANNNSNNNSNSISINNNYSNANCNNAGEISNISSIHPNNNNISNGIINNGNDVENEKKEIEIFSPYLLSPKRGPLDVPQLLLSRESSIVYDGNHLQDNIVDKLDWF